jgi:SAM-dependent methyltransferase
MQKFDEIRNWYESVVPESAQRQQWYGSVAQTYDRLRPKYPAAVWNCALRMAGVPSGRILEVGCGPGTATISLAQHGYAIVALEPSTDTYHLACDNLANYDRVEIINTNFEDWQPAGRQFEAIVAATSWHWVAPTSKYLKAQDLLTNEGALVLLWNTGMQPNRVIVDRLAPILNEYVPTFARYQSPEVLAAELQVFPDEAIASGLFIDVGNGQEKIKVNWPIDDYLQLLTTYSPFIALTATIRANLLAQMRSILVQACGERLDLSYLSIYQVLRNRSS